MFCNDIPYIIDDSTLWDRICINKRPSKKLFEKIVEPKVKRLEDQITELKKALEFYATGFEVHSDTTLGRGGCGGQSLTASVDYDQGNKARELLKKLGHRY